MKPRNPHRALNAALYLAGIAIGAASVGGIVARADIARSVALVAVALAAIAGATALAPLFRRENDR